MTPLCMEGASFEGFLKYRPLSQGEQHMTPLCENHFQGTYPFTRENMSPSLKNDTF
jgi:hypothetical protein